MRKIFRFYILTKTEMNTINWWLMLLDRHRERDQKQWEERLKEKRHEADL